MTSAGGAHSPVRIAPTAPIADVSGPLYDPEVSTPLLATKLFAPPRRPQLVARPRLVEQLDSTLEASHRLTLVSAPAGFGKTTVLGDWLAHLDQHQMHPRVGWLSLDEGDNDLTRLFTHLVAALRGAGLDIDTGVVESLQTASTSAALTALVNDVTRAGEHAPGTQWILVLDDYHVIGAPDVHEAVIPSSGGARCSASPPPGRY